MSDTPKTDAILVQLGASGSTSKFAEHARAMEREATHWQRMCAALEGRIVELEDHIQFGGGEDD